MRAMGLPFSIKERVFLINGKEKVKSVTVQKANSSGNLFKNTEQEIHCAFVCISDGLAPPSEVGSLLNLKHIYSQRLGGYVLLHSQMMETELDGLYVAGNVIGIENAKVAMMQGTLAAYRVLGDQNDAMLTLRDINLERKNAKVKFHKDFLPAKENVERLWKEHAE